MKYLYPEDVCDIDQWEKFRDKYYPNNRKRLPITALNFYLWCEMYKNESPRSTAFELIRITDRELHCLDEWKNCDEYMIEEIYDGVNYHNKNDTYKSDIGMMALVLCLQAQGVF